MRYNDIIMVKKPLFNVKSLKLLTQSCKGEQNMLGTRYEDYTDIGKKIPFILNKDITITPTSYSAEANWHDNLEIQICTEGCGTVMMDEKTVSFEKGEIVVVNSNVLHHTNTDKMIKYTCIIIDTEFCRRVNIDPTVLNFSPKIKSDVLSGLLEKLNEEYHNTKDVCHMARFNIILLEILSELRKKHTILAPQREIKKQSFEVVKMTIKYIRDNYNNKLLLDTIAKNVYTDKYLLSREFKKVTNQTIGNYINCLRCKKASEMIGDGECVSEAARKNGFTNMSYFTKTFKKYMGVLPSKFKK